MDIPPTDPDLPLVLALQAGVDSSLNELMGKYQEPLFRFLYRHTRDEETARDLLQETFVRLYFQIHRFKPRAKFVTWLYSIAMNLARDCARSKHQRQSHVTESLDVIAAYPAAYHEVAGAEPDPAAHVESRERVAELENAIAGLPDALRAAILLFSIEGHSQQECAELLGVSVKAIETRVHRARKILEKHFNSEG